MHRIKTILLLVTLLIANSAWGQLEFEPSSFDFGRIEEAGGVCSCTFVGTNRGTKPIVLVDIVTTCGCTTPTYSRKPIRPGEQTEVVVSYDPYNRPGSFDRKLFLYGPRQERLATLTIRGEVTPRERTIEERYPIELGEGLRTNTTLVTIPHIYIGTPMQSAFSVVNSSDHELTLTVDHTTRSGYLTIHHPERLAPGERSAINICYEVPMASPIYGPLHDAFRLVIGGKPTEKIIVTHGTAVDKPTKSLKECPPKMELSENILKFGTLNRRNGPAECLLTLRNRGAGELIIRAVTTEKGLSTDLKAPLRIASGGEQQLKVWLDPASCGYGFHTGWLTLITNEPEHPIRRVRITATIEE